MESKGGGKEKVMEAIMQYTGNNEINVNQKLAEITDRQFGEGCSEYVAYVIVISAR